MIQVLTDAELAAEQWKPIPGFPNYECSSEGRFRSVVPGRKVRVLSLDPRKDGYLGVGLQANGKHCTKLAHRVVLMTWTGPCPPGLEARHYPDFNKHNIKPSNLSWSTRSINALDNSATRKRTHAKPAQPRRHTSADEIKRLLELHSLGCSQRRIARILGRAQPWVSLNLKKLASQEAA